jgi:CheY-like chemotaxis protein/C4-dicarboxylate-specific signal transduction histidine kinase
VTDHPSVLVIDDEPGLREMLAFELSMEGFAVEAVESGAAAVEALRRRRFDVAITDLKMPGMDGVQTIEAMRRVDPEIEVIVATGYATVETAVACMKRGAYDYIEKPYDVLEVKALLERAMEKSHLSSVVALYEASRAILSTLVPSDLVALVLDLARRILRADAALLVTADPDGGERVHRLACSDAPLEHALRDLARQAEARRAPHLSVNGDGASGLAYPLGARGRGIGCLVVGRGAGNPPFVSSELRKGTVFANQVGLALDNANLYEELGRRVEDLVRTREALVHAEKLSLAGQLAQSVAHEINNPLSLMRVDLDALGELQREVAALGAAARRAAGYLARVPDPRAAALAEELAASRAATPEAADEMAELLGETLGGMRRISDLVSGFRQLAAPPGDQATAGPVDLAAALRRCRDALPAGSGAIELADLPDEWVLASRADLETALSSLLGYLVGAARERAGGGTALVRGGRSGDPDRVLLVISHDRLSLSADELRRLFDPRLEVNTSRGRVLRLNIELAIAYRLLSRGGARIAVHGESPRGVRFEIDLPSAQRSAPG